MQQNANGQVHFFPMFFPFLTFLFFAPCFSPLILLLCFLDFADLLFAFFHFFHLSRFFQVCPHNFKFLSHCGLTLVWDGQEPPPEPDSHPPPKDIGASALKPDCPAFQNWSTSDISWHFLWYSWSSTFAKALCKARLLSSAAERDTELESCA